jgi:outer membrane protein
MLTKLPTFMRGMFCLSCLILCLPGAPRAQTGDTLSLEQAIALAQKNNLTVTAAELTVRQAESHLREVQASRYPSVLFHTHYLHSPVDGYNEIVTNGGEYGLQITSTFPVYDGNVRNMVIHQSMSNQERASLFFQKNQVEIAFTVRTLYYEILRAQAEVRIRQETAERLEDYVSFLHQLRMGGSATESDILKARVDLNNANISLEQAKQSLQKSKLMLANVLGAPLEKSFEILPLPKEDSSGVPSVSIENNPDIRLLRQDLISTGYDISIAKSERLPVVTITGDIGALGVKPNEFHNDLGYSLLLSLELPIFTWGAISDRVEQKELARQQSEAQLTLQQRELETRWNMALSDLEIARKNTTSYSSNISEAERNYLSAKSRLAGGSGSNLEVLDSQRLLVETKLNYVMSLFQARYALATILKLSGQQ